MLTIPSNTKDLGDVKANSPKILTFEIKNDTNIPVLIENMGSSCGCTTPSISQNPVPANSSAIFSLEFKSGVIGNQYKSAWFTESDGTKHTFNFSARVVK